MRFQLLAPVSLAIDGDTLGEALKHYVKLNYAKQINKLIVADQMNHQYNADIEYYKHKNKNKAKIKILPDIGYTMYPKKSLVQPVYRENENGLPPDIVAPVVPIKSIQSIQYINTPLYNNQILNTPLYNNQILNTPLYNNQILNTPLYNNQILNTPLYKTQMTNINPFNPVMPFI